MSDILFLKFHVSIKSAFVSCISVNCLCQVEIDFHTGLLYLHTKSSVIVIPSPLLSSGYHHSLPSSPYTSTAGPDGQRLPPSGTLSSEYLNQGGSTKVLLLICNTAGSGQQAVR